MKAPVPMPASMTSLLEGCEWTRNTVSQSAAEVYRLDRDHCPRFYLKIGGGAAAHSIVDEMVRLRWLSGRAAVPEVRYFATSNDEAWLLMTAVPGESARQLLDKKECDAVSTLDALTHFLLRFHALPIAACPFNSDNDLRLLEARERLEAGDVDEPISAMSMPGGRRNGSGSMGPNCRPLSPIASSHLAVLWSGIGEYGEALRDRFLANYGIASPDARRLQFYIALDEFY